MMLEHTFAHLTETGTHDVAQRTLNREQQSLDSASQICAALGSLRTSQEKRAPAAGCLLREQMKIVGFLTQLQWMAL